MGNHDIYPSELVAQPGESKGQPVILTDSRSILRTACPHHVIARTTVRSAPGTQKVPGFGCAAIPPLFHTSYTRDENPDGG